MFSSEVDVALGAGTERAGVRPDPPGGLGAQCP